MIEEKLALNLRNKGFQILNSNVQGVYLYYRAEENEAVVISVIHIPTGSEYTPEQYRHILEQIKVGLGDDGTRRVNLLSLIFTQSPDRAKQFCSDEDGHWIIDINTRRLIIYETQPSDFYGLRRDLENILEEDFKESNQQAASPEGYRYGGSTPQSGTKKAPVRTVNIFTPVNVTIILINIVVFLITQYSGLFGGRDRMIGLGGDYWYDVVKRHQYYRILTSMFMHSGISHIFNNMLALLFVGSNLERATGKHKYLFLYLGSGIIADITSIVYNMWKDRGTLPVVPEYSIGASGAIFGVVGAMLYIIIVNRGRFKDLDFRQLILFAIFGLYGGVTSAGIDNAAHIGGFISGILLAVLVYRRPARKMPYEGE